MRHVTPNRYVTQGSSTAICLVDQKGRHKALAWIDTEDLEKVKPWRWSFDNGYARATIKGYTVRLHQLIMKRVFATDSLELDHRNRNKLDCRKQNLRVCSRSTNTQNTNLRRNNTSGVKGVWYDKSQNSWIAQIMVNYKRICLGTFKDKQEAIKVRRAAETQYEYST